MSWKHSSPTHSSNAGGLSPTVESLFLEALERAPSERTAFLAVCCPDANVRREVESLVDAHARWGGFDSLLAEFTESAGIAPGQLVGAFRIVRQLGRGGMGEVYLAERASGDFKQRVAIKLMRAGWHSSPVRRQRFSRERQILAWLEHPGVARLVDGGVTPDRIPYFAMEYVEGVPIDEYCEQQGLSVEQRLDLFFDVCQAVQYAHQHHVIHRDLKPSNILVTAEGHPKVLDFGIAKVLDPTNEPTTGSTKTAAWFTPQYAAPEVIRGGQVTAGSDVYSLGVILYELLTGRRPYDSKARSPFALPAAGSPDRPSVRVARTGQKALRRQMTRDLDRVVLKALAAEPADRYDSAEQLTEDLRRLREGRPVIVGRNVPLPMHVPSRRLTAAALVFVVMGAAVALSLADGGGADAAPRFVHNQITFHGNADLPALSPDGESVAYRLYADSLERIVMRDLGSATERDVAQFSRVTAEPSWSPDGSLLRVGGIPAGDSRESYSVVPIAGGPALPAPLHATWHPDGGSWLVWKDDALVSVDDTSRDTTVIARFGPDTIPRDAAWSLDGEVIAAAVRLEGDVPVRWAIWTVLPSGEWNSVAEAEQPLSSPRWSADRTLHYATWNDLVVAVWRVSIAPDGRVLRSAAPVLEPITRRRGAGHLEFGSYSIATDGRRIAYTRDATTTNIWLVRVGPSGTVNSAEQLTTGSEWKGYPALAPHGERVAYVQIDDAGTSVQVVDLDSRRAKQLALLDRGAGGPAWSPDGRQIAVGANDQVWVLDLEGGVARFPVPDLRVNPRVTWRADGRVAYTHDRGGALSELDPVTGQHRILIAADSSRPTFRPVFAPDGRLAVWSWNPYGIYLLEDADSTLTLLYDASHHVGGMIPIRWSADGTEVFAHDMTEVMSLPVEGGSPRAIATLPFSREAVWYPDVSRDGTLIVASVQDRRSDLWLATAVTSQR